MHVHVHIGSAYTIIIVVIVIVVVGVAHHVVINIRHSIDVITMCLSMCIIAVVVDCVHFQGYLHNIPDLPAVVAVYCYGANMDTIIVDVVIVVVIVVAYAIVRDGLLV